MAGRQDEERGTHLAVAVADGSDEAPEPRDADEFGTTGRGLQLVAATSLRWGVDPRPDGGKSVWFELRLVPGAVA